MLGPGTLLNAFRMSTGMVFSCRQRAEVQEVQHIMKSSMLMFNLDDLAAFIHTYRSKSSVLQALVRHFSRAAWTQMFCPLLVARRVADTIKGCQCVCGVPSVEA